MPRTTRVIALGLLCLALASSVLQAAPSTSYPPAIPRAESHGFLEAAWKWLVSIFAATPEPLGSKKNQNPVPSEEGSQLDPDGHD